MDNAIVKNHQSIKVDCCFLRRLLKKIWKLEESGKKNLKKYSQPVADTFWQIWNLDRQKCPKNNSEEKKGLLNTVPLCQFAFLD
jgi:hypothetical protein